MGVWFRYMVIRDPASCRISNCVDRSASADNPRLQPESNTHSGFLLSHKVWATCMILRIHTLSFNLLAVLALAGCASTADLTKNESSTCEVHKCAMAIQV